MTIPAQCKQVVPVITAAFVTRDDVMCMQALPVLLPMFLFCDLALLTHIHISLERQLSLKFEILVEVYVVNP